MKLILYFLLSPATLHAQVIVTSGFVQDSVRIGDRIDYFLAARYPSYLNIVFPDSNYHFGTFEYHAKKYFPTVTGQGESYDSVVYSFLTFEIDDIQYLGLPVFVINPSDCTRYVPLRDSVFLKSWVREPAPESLSAQELPLRDNTIYERVLLLFNYPIVLIIGLSSLVLIITLWLIFGKRIRKYFKLRKLRKKHLKFSESFSLILQELRSQFSARKAEVALSLWKKYLEQLEQKPYTKLTTPETIQMEKDELLGRNLRNLDKAIYGNFTSVQGPLEQLREIADTRFTRKLEEVKNG